MISDETETGGITVMYLSEKPNQPLSQLPRKPTLRRGQRFRGNSKTESDIFPRTDFLTQFPDLPDFPDELEDCELSRRGDAELPQSTRPQTPRQRRRTGTHVFCKHSFKDSCRCCTPLKPDGEGDYCQRCWEGRCSGPRPPGSKSVSQAEKQGNLVRRVSLVITGK